MSEGRSEEGPPCEHGWISNCPLTCCERASWTAVEAALSVSEPFVGGDPSTFSVTVSVPVEWLRDLQHEYRSIIDGWGDSVVIEQLITMIPEPEWVPTPDQVAAYQEAARCPGTLGACADCANVLKNAHRALSCTTEGDDIGREAKS